MTVGLLRNIADTAPRGEPLMGLDVGKKTIGVAVCDEAQRVATPVTTLFRTKFTKDLKEIERLAAEFGVAGFVVGLPLNMDGSEGGQAQSVRDFALELERQISKDLFPGGAVWLALHDERLSTDAVDSLVDEMVDKKNKRVNSKQDGLKDKLAAMIILQEVLDFFARTSK